LEKKKKKNCREHEDTGGRAKCSQKEKIEA
jgi:hypothetical protein